jgi:hypothetical protein
MRPVRRSWTRKSFPSRQDTNGKRSARRRRGVGLINDQRPRRIEFHLELGDPGRLGELRDVFASVQALARIDGNAVVVSLAGRPGTADERHLRAYLQTWLALAKARGDQVRAEVSDV